MSNLKIVDHDRQLGITTTLHVTETKVAIEKSYDAEPMLKMAAEMRAQTAGESWGEVRHVGFIPMAELGTMFRQDGSISKKRLIEFIRKNPALATFDKALK